MNAPFQIRQLAQYPRQDAAIPGTLLLMQMGEAGSPYGSIAASDLVTSALAAGGPFNLSAATGSIVFGADQGSDAGVITVTAGEFLFSAPIRAATANLTFVNASGVRVNGDPVVTASQLAAAAANTVTSFNFRQGEVLLEEGDILRAGGAPIRDAHFGGWITAPSHWDVRIHDDTVATANWVHRVLHSGCYSVSSFNGRRGCVTLQTSDVNAAYAVPGPPFPTASNPALGDASSRIATTLFVDESIYEIENTVTKLIQESQDFITQDVLLNYAPINSPNFTGVPTAPTANPGTNTGELATTAFVQHAVASSTAGVASFNTRTGIVTLTGADITSAGGALLNSPVFVGSPMGPTAAPGTNNTQLATTAFVDAAIAAGVAGVSSFNTRTGAVTLTLADVTGTNVLVNTALTGVPVAPTAAPGNSTTQLATTAFVSAAVSAAGGVTSFMSRTGAITLIGADVSAAGGALTTSPIFSGVPAAPTASPGTNTTQLATTAFVQAALAATGVTSFNGRSGAVTLNSADLTGAGGALLAGPTFTGVPSAPTAAPGTSTTQIATTAFVTAAVPSTFVATFNGRSGAVTLSLADVTGVGGAPIASPTFTGVPAAPTAAPGTNTTQVATTAFVHNAISAPTLRSYLAGLTLSTAGSSATFSVAAGVADVGAGTALLTLASAMSKTTAAWAAGTGNGSLDTGAITNTTWYHVYLIGQVSGVTDILISLSPTSPAIPGAYNYFRRIGSMKTNASGQWIKFLQTGDTFEWDVAVSDVNGLSVSNAAATLSTLASIPPGVKVTAIIGSQGTSTSANNIMYAIDPDTTGATFGPPVFLCPANFGAGNIRVMTNTSQQVKVYGSQATNITGINIYTIGWVDRRGRDA